MSDEPTPTPAPEPAAPPAPTPPPNPPTPGDKGFPEGTALADMTVEQREQYHKFHSRQWQARAEARSDYDDLKAKAAEFDRLKAESATDQEKAVAAARQEGATEALRSANERAARAILRSALTERGKTAEQVDALVNATNLSAFIANDDVDTGRVAAHVDLVAPRSTQTATAPPNPDLGQGHRTATKTTGTATGREIYEQRRKKTPAAS